MAEGRELELNRETVLFIIDKAHEFHVKEGVTIPEESLSPSDDWGRQALAAHGNDPGVEELRNTIDDLEPDQPAQLQPVATLHSLPLSGDLETLEIMAIRRALDAAEGNVSAAARQLGISRNTLYRKLGRM